MIGIGPIRSEIPKDTLCNRERMKQLDATPNLLQNKIGIERVTRMPAGWETSDLGAAAVRRLVEAGAVDPGEIECLILVTQNPDGFGLPHTSAVMQEKLGLSEQCACFDVSLGCSGYVYALSIARGFMETNGMRRGLIVTADPYSKVLDEGDRDTTLLFGDAAAATLMTDAPSWRLLATDFGTRGSGRDALLVDGRRKLRMNGRAVFTFSATVVPQSIERTLAAADLELDSIDRVILHQGSRYIVDRIAQRLGIERRVEFYAGGYGNTVSSSIPIILERDVAPVDHRIVVSGFGVGLSWATAILERVS